jgi:bacterioferritin
MTQSSELVEGLNHALNREVSTALRYLLQAASIQGAENQIIRETYLSEVQDEIGHAQYLANKIEMLGGQPRLRPNLDPPPREIKEMLSNDIEEEKVDAANYLKLATLAEEEGLADLKLTMEEQAAEESKHGEALTRLRG